MDLQKLIDTISKVGADERSNYHLTLGQAIDFLSKADQDLLVQFDYTEGEGKNSPTEPHSYRGYYSDLALEPGEDRTVKQVLEDLQKSLDQEFTGYKGGEFMMTVSTPLWVAHYGDCGRAIMGISIINEKVYLTTKEIE